MPQVPTVATAGSLAGTPTMFTAMEGIGLLGLQQMD